jgi:hypothetical protein
MTCEYIPPRRKRMRLSETYLQIGDEFKAAWLRKHGLDELLTEPVGMIICGTFKRSPRCRCGQVADYLCDEPMGKGKTCDLPLCEQCKTVIGNNLDLCTVHAARQQQGSLFEKDHS